MNQLALSNPFGAPVYHRETVSSTMDEARLLAAAGERHGTVIIAGFQEQGRGRNSRPWRMEPGQNLSFTIIFRYPSTAAIPQALTLRTGLAVSCAVEDFAPPLSGRVCVKWPNDVMIDGKKAAGILTESDGETVYAGIGVNVGQKAFPPGLEKKAVSIAGALGGAGEGLSPYALLEKILFRLHRHCTAGSEDGGRTIRALEARLYRRGERVRFIPGAAGSGGMIEGRLAGLGGGGELLIIPEGEQEPQAFITGELLVYEA